MALSAGDRQEFRADRSASLGEPPLLSDVGGLSRGRLDRDCVVSPVGQVVRRGAHVEHADVARELEGVQEQLAGNERTELDSPFVQVHPGVQAPGLLELGLPLPGRHVAVAGRGIRCEEAERVEMGAPQLVRVDDGSVASWPSRNGTG